MRKHFGYPIAFLVGAVFAAAAVHLWFPPIRPIQIESVNYSQKTHPAWDRNFGRLGLQPGDVLVSVNGNKERNMLDDLVNGYNRGNVCVTFEREGLLQEICLKRGNT